MEQNDKLISFINNANIKHNSFYNYSDITFKNLKTKIKILCPIHGYFLQQPEKHLYGQGCKKCGIEKAKLKNRWNTAF